MEQAGKKNKLEKLGYSLERVIYPFSRYFSFVSMVAALIMMFLVTADVLLRRLLNSPIFGAYEVSKILLSIMVFCGVAYVMSEKGHVVVDTLTRLYPKRIQRVVYAVSYFFSMIIVALISWQSTDYGIAMLQIGEKTVLLRILYAPFIFIVAFGSAVLFFVILVQFIYAVAGVDDKAPPIGFW